MKQNQIIIASIVIVIIILLFGYFQLGWFKKKETKTSGSSCVMQNGTTGTYDANGNCVGEGPGGGSGASEQKSTNNRSY